MVPITSHGPVIAIECFHFSKKMECPYQPGAGHNNRMLSFQQQNGVPITSHRPVITIECSLSEAKWCPLRVMCQSERSNASISAAKLSAHYQPWAVHSHGNAAFRKQKGAHYQPWAGHNDRMLPFQQQNGVPITSHGPVLAIECFQCSSKMECPLPRMGHS